MGWSIGFDSHWDRDIGYGVPAICDHPKCNRKIDRGLSYVCGGEPYGGEVGCGLFFCAKHLSWSEQGRFVCKKCAENKLPYKPKPDVKEWIDWKKTDKSWERWRKENNIKTQPQRRRKDEQT